MTSLATACQSLMPGRLDFTREGKSLYSKLLVLRRDQLSSMLERWDPGEHPEVREMLARLAHHLSTAPPGLPAPDREEHG